MDNPSQKVTRLISQACAQYPGGLRAVFLAIQENSASKRAESTFYADFNPNDTSQGKLKVADMLDAIRITGNIEALRYMASLFGYSLAPLNAIKPDAPTLEAEMLSDYPSLVAFHEIVKKYREGEADNQNVLAAMENATLDIRQTATMARREKN